MAAKGKEVGKPVEEITSFKGFDQNLRCHNEFQFEIGATYEHKGKVQACASGFHACEDPLDVLAYYPASQSRFAVVKQSGDLSRHEGDTKVASRRITVETEITFKALFDAGLKFRFDRVDWKEAEKATGEREGALTSGYSGAASATGYRGAASATGDRGAASATGDSGAASATGDSGAASATGYRGAASATGDRGAASATGDSGAASATGYSGAASATGDRGAASATGYSGAASATGDSGAASATGYRGAASATGYSGAASATGYSGAASATGYRGAASATGYSGAAMASGPSGRVMGKDGCALFLVYRDPNDNWNIKHAWAGIAGRGGIKAETWYSLNENGKPVAA